MSTDDSGERTPRGPGEASVDRRMENLLDELQVQTRRVRDTWQSGEAVRLRILAGELAALASGAGRGDISSSAAELEAVLLAEEAEASALCERIEDLIRQCKQAAED